MARKSMTETTADVTVATTEVATADINAVGNEKVTKGKTVKAEKVVPLSDSDEIEVTALIPNVSYKDSRSGDIYEWDEVGHVEYMTFETLKNMWRNHKGYFKNMCLKPNDERVIEKFGLRKTFENYEYLMDKKNYTSKNITNVCNAISETPNGMKFAICSKIKSMVQNKEVTDASVIKSLEKFLNIELFAFL